MPEIGLDLFALLLIVAFVAGFIDSIAGGGGLIVLPALFLSGLPPLSALATNKLAAIFGSGTATLTYARAGHVNLRTQAIPALLSGFGAALGAMLASVLPVDVFRILLPFILIAVALFFAFKRNLDDQDHSARITPFLFGLTLVPLIGFYDGLFGPGTGTFFMIGFVALAGYGILKATAHTKLLNFASNAGALIAFSFIAKPVWILGLSMGVTTMMGAFLGAKLASRVGARLIKPLLILVSLALALRLLFDAL